MKYIITESKLKKLINDKLGLDYTGDVEEVTSVYNLLNDFDECFSYVYNNHKLNQYGPMYLITVDDYFKILYQESPDGNDLILINNCYKPTEHEVMDLLGIDVLGLTLKKFIEIYL
jgi:hypothetical protein